MQMLMLEDVIRLIVSVRYPLPTLEEGDGEVGPIRFISKISEGMHILFGPS